jgi:hypothetical protein
VPKHKKESLYGKDDKNYKCNPAVERYGGDVESDGFGMGKRRMVIYCSPDLH